MCDWFVRNFLRFLPDKPYLSLRYRCLMGHWMSWSHPKTFSEKLQWLKVYGFRPEYTKMVDKYAVKDYVASIIGEEHIIPTLGVWNRVEDIDWDSLPDRFVLKTTHGGGGGGVVICKDKAKFDRKAAMTKLNDDMKAPVINLYREHPYYKVPRRIIAEQFMEETIRPEVDDLTDYKFFCFDGEPRYCQVIRDRNTKETIDFYDMQWNHMPFVGLNPVAGNGLTPVAGNGLTPVAGPRNLADMQRICRQLSQTIPFCRVDLYNINEEVYFGELTLYPFSGLGVFTPEEWNTKLGELVKLDAQAVGGVIS